MDTKTIAILGAVLIVIVAAGGIYLYMSPRKTQQAPPPQPPQQQGQGGQGGQQGQQGQGGQQGGGTGGTSEQGGQSGQSGQSGQGGSGEQGQTGQQGGQQGSEQPSLGDMFKAFPSSYVMTGTISFKSHTAQGDSEGTGRFKYAYADGNSLQYMKFSGKSQGKPFSGETEFLTLKQGDQVSYIMCFKTQQTQDKWVCMKAPQHMYEQQAQSTGGENPGEKKTEWEQQINRFQYEGVKNIHGVAMHCWLAQYTNEEGYQVQQRVCFDASQQLRYMWWHQEKGGEYSEGDMFIESISTSVPADLFTPPATPQSFPGYGG